MERKRQLCYNLLTSLILISAAIGCQPMIESNTSEATTWCNIKFSCPRFMTRSQPAESVISDLNILIFHGEEIEFAEWSPVPPEEAVPQCKIPLVAGRSYTVYALANLGQKLEINTLTELECHHLEVGKECASDKGCLMSSLTENFVISSESTVTMELSRMIAKISICMDRSQLSDNVDIKVTKLLVGNSPKYIKAIGQNRPATRYDCFEYGHSLNEHECTKLNTILQGGLSEEVSLYIPENMQGDFPADIEEDEEKVLDPDIPLAKTASFIELWLHYKSSEYYSNGRDLIYRFYLGEGLSDLNIERNCHYHITISPEDDGLSGSGWRVDKSGIGTYISQISLSEQTLAMNYKGQSETLSVEILPANATNKSLTWRSSNSKVASISSNGIVKAVGEGSCNISCTAKDGSGCTSSCLVNISFAPPSFIMYPGSYVTGHVGEQIHIWCEFFPPNATFDPGYEELNYDRHRGIYDYKIDENGHGVTLTLKKPGTGIVYMTAGDPINESGMTIIEVNP